MLQKCCSKIIAKQGVSDVLLKDDCKGRYFCITVQSRLDKWQFSITVCRRDYSCSCGSPCGLSDTPGDRQAGRPASCKPLQRQQKSPPFLSCAERRVASYTARRLTQLSGAASAGDYFPCSWFYCNKMEQKGKGRKGGEREGEMWKAEDSMKAENYSVNSIMMV